MHTPKKFVRGFCINNAPVDKGELAREHTRCLLNNTAVPGHTALLPLMRLQLNTPEETLLPIFL